MEQTSQVPRRVRRTQERQNKVLETLVKQALLDEKNNMPKYAPELYAQRLKQYRNRWFKVCDGWNRLNKDYELKYDAFDEALTYYKEIVRQREVATQFPNWEPSFWLKLWYKIRYQKNWEGKLKLYFAENVYEKS